MPNHAPSLACTLVGCCCILIGVILGSIGAGITAGAAEMDPDLHFKMLKKGWGNSPPLAKHLENLSFLFQLQVLSGMGLWSNRV